MDSFKKIEFYEGRFLIKTLSEKKEVVDAYRLRHKVFSETLKWVPLSHDELETDPYDSWAASVGLFSEDGSLVGVFRLLPASRPFMLETEFRAFLTPGYTLRKERDTNEITRLTVDPSLQEKGLSSRMLLVLLKGLYQWLLGNDVLYSYMVVEKRFLRALRAMGFPCKPISPFKALPPAGALSVAAILDWEEFRYENSKKRPEFLEWISSQNYGQVRGQEGGFSARDTQVLPMFGLQPMHACLASEARASTDEVLVQA
jgi:N-acyl-L-homoserine lactone synthetase